MRFSIPNLAVFFSCVAGSFSVLAGPGTITTTVVPSGTPITFGQTFTVIFRIEGMTDGTEIDGVNFKVTYDPALLSFVPGSLRLDGVASADTNWLNLPPQAAPSLTDFTATGPGVMDVSLADLSVSSLRGTLASSGFLCALQMNAVGTGATRIAPGPAADGSVLYDTQLTAAGVPAFRPADVTVLGPRLNLALSGSRIMITWTNTGTLQVADNVTGPWASLTGLPSPYVDDLTRARRFYRLQTP